MLLRKHWKAIEFNLINSNERHNAIFSYFFFLQISLSNDTNVFVYCKFFLLSFCSRLSFTLHYCRDKVKRQHINIKLRKSQHGFCLFVPPFTLVSYRIFVRISIWNFLITFIEDCTQPWSLHDENKNVERDQQQRCLKIHFEWSGEQNRERKK